MQITGKVAIVTGGASGIGLSLVEELLINKIKGVVIAAVNVEAGNKTANELAEKYGPRVLFQKTDVANKEELEDAFKTAIAKFGQLDIVVNNAGIASENIYEKEISINFIAVVHSVALVIKYMSKSTGGNGGTMLTTSSVTALDDLHAVPVYGSTKVAVMNLMRAFGHSFHYDVTEIRMMALLPGLTCQTGIASNFQTIDCTRTKESASILAKREGQTPLAVARAFIHLIKYGESGTSWMVDANKLFLLEHPHWETYSKLIADNLDA